MSTGVLLPGRQPLIIMDFSYWASCASLGLVAAVVTMVVTPTARRLAIHLQAVDVPGGRKRHEDVTPRMGGLAIFVGIALSAGPGLLLIADWSRIPLTKSELGWYGFAVLLVFGMGLVDDIRGLGPFQKLAIQIVAAIVIVHLGWGFSALRLPADGRFALGAIAPVFAVAWIVGVTNAINFIDGLDGLAAGIVAIISSSLLVMALIQGSTETVVVTSCMAGACLGFLRHNWRPAKIYMGDSGSLTLGFLLGTISLRSTPSVKASALLAILVPILSLGLPIIDTLLVLLYRFLKGHRLLNRIARMFHADRAHLHHVLVDNHTDRPRVMRILFGLAAAFCLMAMLVAASGSLWLGVAFLGIEVLAVVLVRRVGLNKEARQVAEDSVQELRDQGPVPDCVSGAPPVRAEERPVP